MKTLSHRIYLGIFLIPVILNPWGMNMYANPKISWFLLFVGLAVIFFGFKVFFQKKSQFTFNTKILFYIGLWTISLLLSTIFSIAPAQSTWGEYVNPQGFIFYLLLFVHFFCCIQIFRDKKNTSLFLKGLKILAALISLHAIGQYFNIDPFTDVDNQQFLFRVYSTIGQPNFLGQFLIFPLVVVFFEIEEAWQQKKLSLVKWEVLLCIFLLVTLFLTKNRATWIALIVSFVIWFLMFCRTKKFHKTLLVSTGFLAGIFFILFNGIYMRSLDVRFLLWEGVFKIINLKNILLGNGLQSFQDKFLEIMPKDVFLYEEFYTIPARPHSEILEVLNDRGLIGTSLCILPIVFLGYLFLRRKIKTLTQKIAFFGVITYMMSVQLSFSVVEHWVFLAAFWAILFHETLAFRSITLPIKNVVSKIFIITPALFAGLCIIFFSFSFLGGDILLQKGFGEYFGDIHTAYATFNAASEKAPFFAYPQKIIIDLFSRFTHDDEYLLSEMNQHFQKFQKITSNNFQSEVLGMKVANAENNLEKVDLYLENGILKSPNLPLLYTTAGNIYFKHGDCEKALKNYEKLLSLAPPYSSMENSDNPEERERYRIFRKHASAFFDAMENMEECQWKKNEGANEQLGSKPPSLGG